MYIAGRRIQHCLSVASILLALSGALSAKEISLKFNRFKNFENRPRGISTNAPVKDSTGFYWMGTENGLYRFDGNRFVQFVHEDTDTTSLSANAAYPYVDSRKRLWVGTPAGHFMLIHLSIPCKGLTKPLIVG